MRTDFSYTQKHILTRLYPVRIIVHSVTESMWGSRGEKSKKQFKRYRERAKHLVVRCVTGGEVEVLSTVAYCDEDVNLITCCLHKANTTY